LGEVIDKLPPGFVDPAVYIRDDADDILAFAAFLGRALAEDPVQ
jgi:hypothetical protein